MTKISGIYGIVNTNNGKIYIGKSTNIPNRFIRHRSLLKNGKHYNHHLQRSYDSYGLYAFEFKMLEECQLYELAKKEQEWVEKYDPDKLYNHVLDVIKLSGPTNPFGGKRHTEETKQKMSQRKKGTRLGRDNPNFGNKQPLEVRIKMIENNNNTKLSREEVMEIAERLRSGEKHQSIAESYGVSRTVITRISNGTRWANVTGGPIISITYKNGVRQLSDSIGKKHTEESKKK